MKLAASEKRNFAMSADLSEMHDKLASAEKELAELRARIAELEKLRPILPLCRECGEIEQFRSPQGVWACVNPHCVAYQKPLEHDRLPK